MEQTYKSPSYYVRKKLFANKPAMFGLAFIVFAHLVASMSYLIMPDDSPNADESMQEIKKQAPPFTVTLLKDINDSLPPQRGFAERMLQGQPRGYKPYAISKYYIKRDSLIFLLYSTGLEDIVRIDTALGHRRRRSNDPSRALSLVEVVRPMYVPKNAEEFEEMKGKYRLEGDTVIYLDPQKQLQKVALADLEAEFKANCLEERTFWLGTDKSGRDILSRLILGARIALTIGFVSVLISLTLGSFLGAVAGYFGGFADKFIMWLMTVVWSIPSIMLVIAIKMALDTKEIWVVFVAVGLTTWVEIARVVRGEILSLKQKLFIEAAKAFGLSNMGIIYKHILPNILGSIIVMASSNFASAILLEAGLSFLGQGVMPPTPSWGNMILEGFDEKSGIRALHLILFPSVCVSALVLSFNLFGNGLRDAYDPRTLLVKN